MVFTSLQGFCGRTALKRVVEGGRGQTLERALSASLVRANVIFLGNGEPQKVFEHGCVMNRSGFT